MDLIEPYEVEALTPDGRPTKRRIAIGRYKTMPNPVRTSVGEIHYYATPEETPAKMGDLMQWYRKEADQGGLHPSSWALHFITVSSLFIPLTTATAGWPGC